MHAIEKILAAHAGCAKVSTGEIVNCNIDVAGINDLYLQTIRSFYEIGGVKVACPNKVIMFMDHYAPASTIQQADNQRQFRAFCDEQGIKNVMDIDQGVCHQVAIDHGFTSPGKLIVITDSHTTMHGALGAFGTGVGATDMATILISGQLWFRVPEVIKIVLDGKPRKGVFAKDIILYIIGKFGADYGVYRVIEFAGETVENMAVSERLALCNMTTEIGAKTAWIQPDKVTFNFMKSLGLKKSDYTVYDTDLDYQYLAVHHIDVSKIEPQIAEPNSVDNVYGISHSLGTRIDQAYLGSCTGGRLEDLEIAARIIKGKHVKHGTRFLVVPATKKILLESIKRGIMAILIEAGATFVTPGCAACIGIHEGILASGENCITSSSRNFPGRMGSSNARIYLASSAAVAAAAIAGAIVDPADYM
jgi:homoaconitate hydratase family protein